MTQRTTGTGVTSGELYAQALASTERFVAAVKPEQWTLPTPCTEWTVRDIVNHLCGENLWAGELFKGRTIAEVGSRFDGDLLGDDPIRAYGQSAQAARMAALAPGAMETTCHLSFGDFPGAEYASQLFLDTLIHGWDIAEATGQDTRLIPSLVAACLPLAERYSRDFADAGVFAPPVPVGADASPRTRLLALVGRRG